LLSIPGARAAREHHRLHHDKALMGRYNFNVVFPLWDWICGTTSKGRL
jgi:sterol desaturase/sphingolipid hydroxylase (fatty acid hydroxylase superfamily)